MEIVRYTNADLFKIINKAFENLQGLKIDGGQAEKVVEVKQALAILNNEIMARQGDAAVMQQAAAMTAPAKKTRKKKTPQLSVVPKKRGRKPGSKNKKKVEAVENASPVEAQPPVETQEQQPVTDLN